MLSPDLPHTPAILPWPSPWARRAVSPTASLSWDAFAARWTGALDRGAVAEAALRRGDLAPAADLLSAWTCFADPSLAAAARRALETVVADPPPALCGPLPPPADRGPTLEIQQHRELWARVPRGGAPSARAPAWALATLGFWGSDLRRRERAWTARWPQDAALDFDAAAAWAGWFHGNPFPSMTYINTHLLPVVCALFAKVMGGRGIPAEHCRRVTRDLEEGLFFHLLHEEDGRPAWLDLALRVLERGGAHPLDALARLGVPWEPASRCLAGRRRWAPTLRRLWPDVSDAGIAARRLQSWLEADPGALGPLLDLHLLGRICAHWRDGGRVATSPDSTGALLRQNTGRVRARLRALLAENPGRLLSPLLALEGLHARTVEATRRFAWAWVHAELGRDFELASVARLTPICQSAPRSASALPEATAPALQTWVLLVVLRDRADHLVRWVQTGRTGDRDSVWGRLLSKDLPCCLRDRGSAGRPYRGLRAALDLPRNGAFTPILPALRAVAALSGCKSPRRPFELALRPSWDERVPFPERGSLAMVRNAIAFLARRAEIEVRT